MLIQSLRVRLVLLIGTAIIAAAAVQFAVSFHAVTKSTDSLFDYHMEQMALAIQNGGFERVLWHTFPETGGEDFDFVIQTWNEEGDRLYQSRADRFVPKQPVIGYTTVKLDDGDWRIYALKHEDQSIQIAQKMTARRDRAVALAFNTLWPVIPVSIMLLISAWWFVTSALAPLTRVRRELAQRNADSLAPVDMRGVPREVAPLITELNYLLERMQHALQTQQQFLADAAHELRSPITALKLQTQMLSRVKDEAARNQAVGRLLGGIDRASRLVEQLLALARQDPLSQAFQPTTVSLASCVEQAANDVAAFAQSRQIKINAGVLPPAQIWGDAESLRVMIRNLLDNAVRYTPEQGTIDIDLAMDRASTRLTISDSGSGIPEEDHVRIFNRFYRLPGTGPSGTGLGLAIVKAIADRHNTTVALKSPPNGGLAVTMTFPALPA